jgi:hypothetical protein
LAVLSKGQIMRQFLCAVLGAAVALGTMYVIANFTLPVSCPCPKSAQGTCNCSGSVTGCQCGVNVNVPMALVVDLSQPLPQQLDLIEGGGVVFENDLAKIEASATDGKGTLFEPRPHNTFNQAAAFAATRTGVGEIKITFQNQPAQTIKVTVSSR